MKKYKPLAITFGVALLAIAANSFVKARYGKGVEDIFSGAASAPAA